METIIARHEYKYIVAPDLVEPIRRSLRPYCRLDEHAALEKEGFYRITCLYLDDDRYTMFWEGEMGAPVRAQLRIRAYGEDMARPVKLEVKRRIHDLVVKSSVSLACNQWRQSLSAPVGGAVADFGGGQKAVLEQFVLMTRARHARPRMLVRYERQAFRSLIDHYVRITFDRRIMHQPMTAYDLGGLAGRWRAADNSISMAGERSGVVLELKFPASGAPRWLIQLVRSFGLVRAGYSKYGSAVRRHLLEKEAAWGLTPSLRDSRLDWGRKWISTGWEPLLQPISVQP